MQVAVARVDVDRRELDFRIVGRSAAEDGRARKKIPKIDRTDRTRGKAGKPKPAKGKKATKSRRGRR